MPPEIHPEIYNERGQPALPRRRFLFGLALPALTLPALGGLVALPAGPAMAARQPERGLVIHHQHTGEWLRTVYFADGAYLEDSLRDINRVLRDWRPVSGRPPDRRQRPDARDCRRALANPSRLVFPAKDLQ